MYDISQIELPKMTDQKKNSFQFRFPFLGRGIFEIVDQFFHLSYPNYFKAFVYQEEENRTFKETMCPIKKEQSPKLVLLSKLAWSK